ncbi:MAG: Wzz/FepE/Etk N-terminal domain-containing protein [Deltaproteobacteria bacterium]|nr:Wzz/FepE/Etk N-terminal domain-containing protein [Deltaproteobacteria bacterium]
MVNKEERNTVTSQSGNYQITQDDEINLYDLWKVIVKRKKIIITIFLISLLCATVYSFTASPIFRLEAYLKIYMPLGITTVRELPTGKDVLLMIGKIDREKRAIIFSKNANEITKAEISEIRGATDKFKVTIESRNRENLPADMQEMITYIEKTREIKSSYEKIISEIDARIKNVKEADKKNDFHIREIEKRLNSTKLLPVGFNPVEINQRSIDVKMEKYRCEHERKNYKLIQSLDDPFISKYPVKPAKAMIMTIAGIGGLLFAILVAFVGEYVEGMNKKKQGQSL